MHLMLALFQNFMFNYSQFAYILQLRTNVYTVLGSYFLLATYSIL